MDLLAIVTAALLTLIGLLHFYWVFGGTLGLDRALPTKEGKRLLEPGKGMTFLVGLLLLGFASVACALRFGSPVGMEATVYAGWALSALFLLRAVGEFNAVGFFKKITSTPFAEYDTKYYSPLCAALALAFALLASQA